MRSIVLPPNLPHAQAQHHLGWSPHGPDARPPGADRPSALDWNRRITTRTGRDLYRIVVPCPGASREGGVDADLTEELRRRLITTAPQAPWHITSLVVAFGAGTGDEDHLTLSLTATVQAIGAPPLDDAVMARAIDEAVSL